LVASNEFIDKERHGMAKKKYKFTCDWFSEGIPIWQKILKPFTNQKNVAYLEVGVWEGRSLIWMLEHVLTHATSRATVIDLLPAELKDAFFYNLNLSGHRKKVEVFEGLSQKRLMELSDNRYDIIYLDGSHKAKSILMDLMLAWELLPVNGILIVDDYLWKTAELPIDQCPKAAIDSFLTFYGEELEISYAGYQLYIRKKMRSFFDQDKSFLKKDVFFHWELGKLFRIKKDAVADHIKTKAMNPSAIQAASEEIPLSQLEIDFIIKYLMSKKYGQIKPDLNFLNQEERKMLKKIMTLK
jgi:predicted O-methyltransferase YrrM